MLARGLSVRDIEDAFKDEHGRLLLWKTAVSQLGERLWEDYQAFAQRDLGEYEITYLFVDGIAERLRPGAKREPVQAAQAVFEGLIWPFLEELGQESDTLREYIHRRAHHMYEHMY